MSNLICSKCGAEVPQGFKFCGQCGSPVQETRELEKAERRVVTVLFGDICGFTKMSESMDPEDVRTQMNTLFKKLTSAITELDGTVDKYGGDSIMALFGAPESHEDDPERAVRTALKMQAIMADSGLNMRIGINKGLCISGEFGSDIKSEYTVIGDTVNVASRLENAAKPGSIFVSEPVYEETKYLFDFAQLPPMKFKNKKEPVPVYEVLGLREKPLSKRGIKGAPCKIIDREKELNTFQECFNQVSQGNFRIVSIFGEAGIGKSRLVKEFKSLIQGTDTASQVAGSSPAKGWAAIWLESNGVEYLKTVEYRVILEMVAQYFDIKESTPKEQIQSKLKELLTKLSIPDIFPYINYLFTIKRGDVPESRIQYPVSSLDPASLRQEIFQSFKKFFLAVSEIKPLIIVFEDAHWSDKFSMEVAKELADFLINSKQYRILIIFTLRAIEEKEFLKIFGKVIPEDRSLGNRYICSLHLKPLDVTGMSSLVNSILGTQYLSLASGTKKLVGTQRAVSLHPRILEKAEGNPFYLEEIVKSLIDNKILVEEGGQWELVREVTKFDIPTGLHGIIMARIDSLSKSEKEIFKICSVIGEKISKKILEKVAKDYMGMSPEKVSVNLGALEKEGIILPKFYDEQIGGEVFYTPAHSLFQEVAYESLLKETRKDLHESVGNTIENAAGEINLTTWVEILAYHYSRSENYQKAVHYLTLSGRKNETILYAGVDAFENYTSAIEFFKKLSAKGGSASGGDAKAQDAGSLIDLYYRRGDTSRLLLGEYDKAISDFLTALDLARENALPGHEIRVLSKLGSVYRSKGAYDTALEYYEKAMALSKASQSKREIPTLWNKIGNIYSDKGDHKNALKYYNIALEMSEENREELSRVLNNLAVEYDTIGEFNKALQYYEQCLKIEEERQDKRGIAGSYSNIGLLYKNIGDYNKALVYLAKALVTSEEISYHQGIAIAFSNLGDTHYKKGEWDKALFYQQKALKIKEDIGYKWGLANSLDSIGMIYQKLENWDKALEHHEKALNIAKQIESKVLEANSTINLGYVKYKIQNVKCKMQNAVVSEGEKLISLGLRLAYETGEKEIIEYGEKLKRETTVT